MRQFALNFQGLNGERFGAAQDDSLSVFIARAWQATNLII